MKWFYADAGKQLGPLEDDEFDRLVGQGVVRGDTLVWHDGMPAWQALGVVRGWQNASAAPGFPAAAPSSMAGQVHYGGFWIRFLARLIDGVLLGIVNLILRIPLAIMLGVGTGAGFARPGAGMVFLPAIMGMVGISAVIGIAIGVAYEVYFVSTRGGTLGKLALGLKIVRADGSAEPLPGLFLYRISRPNEPTHNVYLPSLCLIAQGSKEIALGEQRYWYDPEHYLIVAVDLPYTGRIVEATPDRPYLSLRPIRRCMNG